MNSIVKHVMFCIAYKKVTGKAYKRKTDVLGKNNKWGDMNYYGDKQKK